MTLAESKFGHGARKVHPLRRKLHRLSRVKSGKAPIPFDWSVGYDVRDKIGQIQINNQGSSSSCSGQAASYFLEIQERLRGTTERISAKSIYAPIAYRGGGTTVSALETQVGSVGATTEQLVPSYQADGVTPLSEAMMIEKSWLTPQTELEALTRAGYTPVDLSENIEDIATAIRDYGCAIWEIKGQNNGTWLTLNPNPPVKGGAEVWYHFMILIAAKMINGKKTIVALNSWGTSIGDNGEQHFNQAYFDAKGIIDAFTFIYDAHVKPTASNTSIWAEIARYFRLQWGLGSFGSAVPV